jgi:hypothetical protein
MLSAIIEVPMRLTPPWEIAASLARLSQRSEKNQERVLATNEDEAVTSELVRFLDVPVVMP